MLCDFRKVGIKAEGWKDALQLLKEQSAKMEKLARALSVPKCGSEGPLHLENQKGGNPPGPQKGG